MKNIFFWLAVSALTIIVSCDSDDNGNDGTITTKTSFSGVVLYADTRVPVTNGNLFIVATDSEPLRSPIIRADTILTIDDGSFEVSFETIEEVDRFVFSIQLLEGDFIINTFGWADGLECPPGDCRAFAPGQIYDLTITVPCDPNDCIRFPPPQ